MMLATTNGKKYLLLIISINHFKFVSFVHIDYTIHNSNEFALKLYFEIKNYTLALVFLYHQYQCHVICMK
jgi:hypothetical protein